MSDTTLVDRIEMVGTMLDLDAISLDDAALLHAALREIEQGGGSPQ